ncbi:NupC/NupG family nucleoside CNT transporter [bacterium]|nr:NupC/NupG family nucleoside CNT transporter [bacterium]
MSRIIPFFGILVMMAICLAMSKDRKAALKRWPLMAWGLGLQLIFALIILRTTPGEWFFTLMNNVFMKVIEATQAGSEFVFGELAKPGGQGKFGFYFAFNVLPTIIFFSALTAILYQLGIMQLVVKGIAWVMAVTMKTSGAETLSASGNIFVGQTEAPLIVRPFVPTMTRSELMTVMTGGFATVAGGVMAAYVGMLSKDIPGIAGHLLAASVMSAPAALMFGKLIVPETETPETLGKVNIDMPKQYDGVVDAAAGGAGEGVKLALNVGGMLIAFLALIAVLDLVIGLIGGAIMFPFGDGGFHLQEAWNLKTIVGYIFSPLAFMMGVPKEEMVQAGRLMGLKTIANEFVAFADLQSMGEVLSPRTRVIMTYALAGFANIGSIGIQIGGLVIMAPQRRADLARLGFVALIAGTFAANSTACVAAILYDEAKDPSELTVSFEVPEATDLTPLLSWSGDKEMKYEVYVWEQGTDHPDQPTTVVEGFSTVLDTPLKPGASYYWYVVGRIKDQPDSFKSQREEFKVPGELSQPAEEAPAPEPVPRE